MNRLAALWMLVVMLAITPSALAQLDACAGGYWTSLFTDSGVNGPIYATAVWDPDGDGPQPELLVVGGDFDIAGPLNVQNLAAWDGRAWSDVSGGVDDTVRTLVVHEGRLIVGGHFEHAGGVPASRVAALENNTWSPLTSGMNNTVRTLAVHDGKLYAGGFFTEAGGVAASHVACWDGLIWAPLGSGVDKPVRVLASIGDTLYAGGDFGVAGGQIASRVAAWSGSAWAAVGAGFNGNVYALTDYQGDLIAGGGFTGSSGQRVSRWTGTEWVPFGAGFDQQVQALHVVDDTLYACGWFTAGGGTGMRGLARWTGQSWQSVAGNAENLAPSYALGSFAGELHVGGNFASGIRRVTGGLVLETLAPSINGRVLDVIEFDNKVLVCGEFNRIGDLPVQRIAAWDGTRWLDFSAGIPSNVTYVSSFAVWRGQLFAGLGRQSFVPGPYKLPLARFDGQQWVLYNSPQLLYGNPSYTDHLAVADDVLYLAGDFNFNSDPGLNVGVARFDGITATALPAFLNPVESMAWFKGQLYVSGIVSVPNNPAAKNLIRWNDATWELAGAAPNNGVERLRVDGDRLYIAGRFTQIGSQAIRSVGIWDGATWQGLPAVPPPPTATDFAFYRGTPHMSTPSSTLGRMARYSGASWLPLGTGLDGPQVTVSYLGEVGDSLWVSGRFERAGSKPAVFLAAWTCTCLADLSGDGVVSDSDLGLLLDQFGCQSSCSADLTGDGLVNDADLGLLLDSLANGCQ